jgi:hypothetical protein
MAWTEAIYRMDLRRFDLNLLIALDALLAECNVSGAAERPPRNDPHVKTCQARLSGCAPQPAFPYQSTA